MSKIAVDIVLIPPKDIINKSVEANQGLQTGLNKIPLDATTHVPHITLAMGVIENEHLAQVLSNIGKVATQYNSFSFKINHLYHAHLPTNEDIVGFGLSKPQKLQHLHTECMQAISAYTINDFDKEVLFDGATADNMTLDFIRHFPEKSVGSHFSPHLTIGFGHPDHIVIPEISFEADNLAVYQLGNYCTCQKELATFKLKNNA